MQITEAKESDPEDKNMSVETIVQEKANVLIEALPYIQRFNRKIIVVKYGGSAMTDENLKKNVIKDVTLLKLVGFKPIIVHGGGKEISKWVTKTGMEPRFVNGLRVTDADTMEIAEMVLGKVGKQLVRLVEELGVKAVSISGKDGMMLKCKKKYSRGEDIGFVGEITENRPATNDELSEMARMMSGGGCSGGCDCGDCGGGCGDHECGDGCCH